MGPFTEESKNARIAEAFLSRNEFHGCAAFTWRVPICLAVRFAVRERGIRLFFFFCLGCADQPSPPRTSWQRVWTRFRAFFSDRLNCVVITPRYARTITNRWWAIANIIAFGHIKSRINYQRSEQRINGNVSSE